MIMPKRNKQWDAIYEHIVGLGAMLIVSLLIFPWWLNSVFVAVIILYLIIEINWYYQPEDYKRRLLEAKDDYEEARTDNLRERLNKAEWELEELKRKQRGED